MKRITIKSIFIFTFCFGCSSTLEHREKNILEKVRAFDQLVVVHPTFYFDKDSEAKDSITRVASYFIRAGVPVATFVETDSMIDAIRSNASLKDLEVDSEQPSPANYVQYFPEIHKTQLVESKNGENQIRIKGSSVVVIGGYLAACLKTAVRDLIRYNRAESKTLRIYMPLDAIYGKGLAKDIGPKTRLAFKAQLESHLPTDTNLRFYVNRQEVFRIDNSGKYNLEIFLRRPEKTIDGTLMAF